MSIAIRDRKLAPGAIGLLVGLALVYLATHVMSGPNIASDLALMIAPPVWQGRSRIDSGPVGGRMAL
jgi:hypothetical protein